MFVVTRRAEPSASPPQPWLNVMVAGPFAVSDGAKVMVCEPPSDAA